MLSLLTIPIVMRGSGSKTITIPRGYKYLSVENPTGYNVNVYSDSDQSIEKRLLYVPIYTVLPVALETGGVIEAKVLVVWTGTGVDKLILKLSPENLGTGQSLVAPGGSSSVIISGDGVGLTKQGQLPSTLTGTGNLKVAVNETVGLKTADLNIDASDNIGVTIENSPAVTVTSGSVAVSNIPHVIVDSTTNPANLDATISSLITAVNGITNAVNTLKDASLKAATEGIKSTSRVTVNTTATVLFNGVVNGKTISIQNLHDTNILYLGPVSVTNANSGCKVLPGVSYNLDVVPGSTIVIYGVGTASLTAGITVIN